MSNDQTTFQNANLDVSIQRMPKCGVKFEITVSPKAAAAAREKAIKNVSKEVSIPGFRKGKAPANYIEKNFSHYVEKEWKELMLRISFKEALDLVKIYPLKTDSVTSAAIKELSLDSGGKVVVEFEAGPLIPLINSHDLKKPSSIRQALTEQMTNRALEDLCIQHAEWEDVVDRPVQEGDFVEIDIDALNEPAHTICSQKLFHVYEGKIDPWIHRLLIGAETGAVIEAMNEPLLDAEACNECSEGTHVHSHITSPVKCRIILHKIKRAKLPPADDELAKKFGADNLAQMKERLVISLEKQLEDRYLKEQRLSMQQQLLNKYPFEVPASLTLEPINSKRRQLIDDLRKSGIEEAEVLEQAKQIELQAMQKLENQFRLYYLTQKIFAENNLQLSDREVMEEVRHQYLMSKMGQSELDFSKELNEVVAEVRFYLEIVKAVDFLIEHAKN